MCIAHHSSCDSCVIDSTDSTHMWIVTITEFCVVLQVVIIQRTRSIWRSLGDMLLAGSAIQ